MRSKNQDKSQSNPYRKRSLAELDNVLDEIMALNPEFVAKLLQFVADEQKANQSK